VLGGKSKQNDFETIEADELLKIRILLKNLKNIKKIDYEIIKERLREATDFCIQ
jgi:hypothetical protein